VIKKLPTPQGLTPQGMGNRMPTLIELGTLQTFRQLADMVNYTLVPIALRH